MSAITPRLPRPSLRRVGTAVAAIALLVGWAIWLTPAGLGGPVSLVWVQGTSMEPTYAGDDIAVVYATDRYDVGDVVAFHAGDSIVIHRIIDRDTDGLILQGDNRDFRDPWTPSEDDVLGEAVLRLPAGGTVLGLLRRPVVLGLLAAALAFMAVLRHGDRAGGDSRPDG